ncbi:cytochrome o ubiquinol oxidase subunit IV [Candidatus Saccharibacteria bacterium]|nr:cytochrome o ubiquinol oxidase subunit IV [Candidatus Saccharibacteria bacterium]
MKRTPSPLAAYVTGFGLSLVLTLAAYLLVTGRLFSNQVLIYLIAALALIQFGVQMVFFLHLGQESRPRWKLLVMGFMVMVVVILVVGSIWIMNNLSYHSLSPSQVNTYIHNQDGL